ncbi:hypothetical protein ZWY2020_058141 [Hordeum vulgare]|nr:hypothetical protein ZWY2020_058141 [Hordeum vulgare]
MKLLVDTRPPRPRVVFAEAGKDAVDFLFSLLTLPAGTAVRLLGRSPWQAASATSTPASSGSRAATCVPASARTPSSAPPWRPLLRLPVPPAPAPRTFFMCGTTNQFNYQGCRGYVSDTRGARCPACGNEMATQSQYVAALAPAQPEQGAATATTGYVQGGVT